MLELIFTNLIAKGDKSALGIGIIIRTTAEPSEKWSSIRLI